MNKKQFVQWLNPETLYYAGLRRKPDESFQAFTIRVSERIESKKQYKRELDARRKADLELTALCAQVERKHSTALALNACKKLHSGPDAGIIEQTRKLTSGLLEFKSAKTLAVIERVRSFTGAVAQTMLHSQFARPLAKENRGSKRSFTVTSREVDRATLFNEVRSGSVKSETGSILSVSRSTPVTRATRTGSRRYAPFCPVRFEPCYELCYEAEVKTDKETGEEYLTGDSRVRTIGGLKYSKIWFAPIPGTARLAFKSAVPVYHHTPVDGASNRAFQPSNMEVFTCVERLSVPLSALVPIKTTSMVDRRLVSGSETFRYVPRQSAPAVPILTEIHSATVTARMNGLAQTWEYGRNLIQTGTPEYGPHSGTSEPTVWRTRVCYPEPLDFGSLYRRAK